MPGHACKLLCSHVKRRETEPRVSAIQAFANEKDYLGMGMNHALWKETTYGRPVVRILRVVLLPGDDDNIIFIFIVAGLGP